MLQQNMWGDEANKRKRQWLMDHFAEKAEQQK